MIKSINLINELDLKDFDCGNKDLNNYLKKYAVINDHNGYGKTFVLEDKNKIIGYYTLCSSSIKFEEYPIDDKSLPKYPIPAIKLARLAVSKDYQKHGYGKELLKDAFLRILSICEIIGVRMVVVDAKDDSIKFYEQYGFMKLNSSNEYFLLIDTIKEALN